MKKAALLMVLVVALVFGVVGYAAAGTWSTTSAGGAGNKTIDNSASLVNINAKVNPKISLQIDTPQGAGASLLVDFGTIDPGVQATASSPVTLTVNSNRPYTCTWANAGANLADLALVHSLANGSLTNTLGQTQLTDTYKITPDYNLDAAGGPYVATVKYTLAQQ